jgi:hypothetical protein
MKHVAMTIALTLLLGLAAYAQSSSPNDPQSAPQGSSPAAAPGAQQTAQPAQTPDMQTPSNPAGNTSAKSEKKLKGCVRSENGKFFLEKKNGEKVELTGSQDLSAHVGHTVAVHGSEESAAAGGGAAGTPTASGSSAPAGGGAQFSVSKVDMVSDTCSLDKGKGKTDKSSSPAPDHQ